MPTLSRWYIRTALAWLVAALAVGPLLQSGVVSPAIRADAWPAYLHLITVGWLTGFIFGVAWWLFPRPDKSRADRTALGWASYALLNCGVLLRAVAEPAVAIGSGDVMRAVLVVAAIAQFAGVAVFTAVIWPRVRAR